MGHGTIGRWQGDSAAHSRHSESSLLLSLGSLLQLFQGFTTTLISILELPSAEGLNTPMKRPSCMMSKPRGRPVTNGPSALGGRGPGQIGDDASRACRSNGHGREGAATAGHQRVGVGINLGVINDSLTLSSASCATRRRPEDLRPP